MVLTNVYGAALTIRACSAGDHGGPGPLPAHRLGRRPPSAAGLALLGSTKWAITGMGESLRQEVNDTGVRVTVIEPGMVDTPFFDNPVTERAPTRGRRAGGDVRRSRSRRTSTSTRSSCGRRPSPAERPASRPVDSGPVGVLLRRRLRARRHVGPARLAAQSRARRQAGRHAHARHERAASAVRASTASAR